MPSWKFFPVEAGSKKPALEGDWRKWATDDEAQIAAWEAAGYNLALDCEASDVTVIDLDGGEVGQGTWERLQVQFGCSPPTYQVRTPSGGTHIYFTGLAPSSVQKLGKKVDTRGLGGYVLVPPSTIAGVAYAVDTDMDPAPLPGWIPSALARADKAHAQVDDLDLPSNVLRATAYLDNQESVEERNGADARTYETAARLRELGVSADKSIDLMLAHYKCWPKDDRFEAFITRKVENAWEYGQNEPGAWGVTSGAESFRAYLDSAPASTRGDKPDPWRALNEAEQDSLKPATYLMPDFWPDKTLTMLYGQSGSYKSFIALDAALTMCAGIAGWEMPDQEERPLVYLAGEGPRSIARLRRPAWRLARGVKKPIPFHLVTNMPHPAFDGEIDSFIASIKRQDIRPAGVIVDTLARFMSGLNENDAKDCGMTILALDKIRNELDCGVFVVHHTGKEEGKGPRGSSALIGGFDTLHEVISHKATKAVAVHNRLQKDADERTVPWFFEGRVHGDSLVFHPIDAAAHKSLTVAEEQLSGRVIGAALLALGARGDDHAVTTHALAGRLYQGAQDEPPEMTMEAVERLTRQLRAAAKFRLETYCNRVGRELLWCLPA